MREKKRPHRLLRQPIIVNVWRPPKSVIIVPALIGFTLGLSFVMLGVTLILDRHGETFGLASFMEMQRRQPLLWIIDAVPVGFAVFGFLIGIREGKLRNDVLAEAHAWQQSLLDNSPHLIIATQPDGTITTFNKAAERALGYRADEVIGLRTPFMFVDPLEVAATAQLLGCAPTFEEMTPYVAKVSSTEHPGQYVRKDGSRFPVMLSLTAIRDNGKVIGYLSVGQDATLARQQRKAIKNQIRSIQKMNAEMAKQRLEMAEAISKLEELNRHDPLTGVANHAHFQSRVDAMVDVCVQVHLPMSLVSIDVDHFKRFNDRYGHLAGDEVLKKIGIILREHLRMGDLAARPGGEEFAILLPITGPDDALELAESLRTAIESEPWPNRQVTASFGVATTGFETNTAEKLQAAADKALYKAKRAGRNRVETHLTKWAA